MIAGLDPTLYELINLVLATLCGFVLVIFVRYLATEIHNGQLTVTSLVIGPRLKRHEMAISIAFMVAGEGGMRAWTWYARFADRLNQETLWMADLPWIFTPAVCAAVQVLGLLCCVRVFTPDEWGNYGWTVAAFVIVAEGVVLLSIF